MATAPSTNGPSEPHRSRLWPRFPSSRLPSSLTHLHATNSINHCKWLIRSSRPSRTTRQNCSSEESPFPSRNTLEAAHKRDQIFLPSHLRTPKAEDHYNRKSMHHPTHGYPTDLSYGIYVEPPGRRTRNVSYYKDSLDSSDWQYTHWGKNPQFIRKFII